MKTFSWSLLILFSFVAISVAGCGEEPKPASMTEGVPLSDIEAYEQEVLAMQMEDAAAMDINEDEPETPAEIPAEPPAE